MEPSTTPWRVFDAPSTDAPEEGGAKARPAQPPGGASALAAPNTRVAIAGVVGAVVIGAIAVVVVLSGSGRQVIDAPPATGLTGSAPNDAAMLAGAGEVVIDVSGAVNAPGLYHLPAGSRVGDAIEAAGGFSPRVDAAKAASSLNLAAALTDGSQVHVPSRDDRATPAGGGGTGVGSGSGAGAGTSGGSLVDLNTASASELDALPGIGPVTAAKIIDSRTTTPFRTIEELRERKLVGEKTFEQLKSLVTVG